MEPEAIIRDLAVLLVAGLAAEVVASLLRLPPMLVLLAAGMALGPSALGVLDVPLDSSAAQLVLTLGVAVILFHGGLKLSLAVLRRVAVTLGLLAVPGVLLTSVVTGAAASAAFGVPMASGLVIGAALAPTDPAILVPLFDRMSLPERLSQTIIAESGFNDPVGAVLALAFAGAAVSGTASVLGPAVDALVALLVSTACGAALGGALCLLVCTRRVGVWRESAPLAAIAVVAAAYWGAQAVAGSGYLAAFVAGLTVGNVERLGLGIHPHHAADLRRIVASAADATVMLLFITLGASLPLGALGAHLLPALAVVATLVLVARPLTVLASVLPDRRSRWTGREMVFLAWTRETGVMPAALAGVLVAEGVPDGELIVVSVALAVILTLAVQATSKPWLAGRLGLARSEPALERC